MNLREARNELRALTTAGNAVLLSSGSGIGKSQMVYQDFLSRKASDPEHSWGFGVIFLATQTPPDLIGFQFKGERDFPDGQGGMKRVTVTDPSVPLWMLSTEGKPAWMYDRFYLLIDEWGQGEGDTKRAAAEILLNGGTSPWYLPPRNIRVACTNQGARYGISKDFDFCIARRTVLHITGDVDVWLSDFADKPYQFQGRQWQTLPVVKAWAASNPGLLFEPEPKEQGPWCNPRTLCAADRYLQVKAATNGGTVPTDPLTVESVAGTVGMPVTQSLMGYVQFALELPSYDDVVKDPQGTPVPTKADLLMLMTYMLAGYAKAEHLTECITYIQRIEKVAKDMGVAFVGSLLRRDYNAMIDQPALQGWISKNASLVSLIGSLS